MNELFDAVNGMKQLMHHLHDKNGVNGFFMQKSESHRCQKNGTDVMQNSEYVCMDAPSACSFCRMNQTFQTFHRENANIIIDTHTQTDTKRHNAQQK